MIASDAVMNNNVFYLNGLYGLASPTQSNHLLDEGPLAQNLNNVRPR
jgi:hypothetical protein